MFCVIYVWGKALKGSKGYEFFPVYSFMYIHSIAWTGLKNRCTIFLARELREEFLFCKISDFK